MAKFLITYKVEKVEHQTFEIEDDDIMTALDNARKRGKALSSSTDSEDPIKTIWNFVGIKTLDGE
jgi:FKBP-type peptidyl-prolyl cis-trans isomerase (trigger factor)